MCCGCLIVCPLGLAMCVQGPCQEECRVSEAWKEEKHRLEFEAWKEEHGLELLQQADEARAASSSSSLWHLPSYLVSYRLHMVDIGSG